MHIAGDRCALSRHSTSSAVPWKYTELTATFIRKAPVSCAMTESIIQGFNTGGGSFIGLPANKIAIGLPACPSAAGGGYTNIDSVKTAMDYLLVQDQNRNIYTSAIWRISNALGMMTWSINWDAVVHAEVRICR